MKKWMAILLAAVMLLGCAAVAEDAPEQTRAQGTAHKMVEWTMDGKLDEFNTADPLVLNDATQLVRDGHFWNGPDDLSAKIYIAWDETNLYIGAEVNEDSVFGAIETLPLDGMDNFQIYLSTNPADDPNRTEYGINDFKFYLIMDGEYWDTAVDRSMVPKDNRMRYISKGLDGGESVLEGYECMAEQATMGFTYECKIPWACFSNERIAVYTPAVGDTVNFNFLITDISYPCPGTEFVPQIAWTGNASMDTNPSVWGLLTFAE